MLRDHFSQAVIFFCYSAGAAIGKTIDTADNNSFFAESSIGGSHDYNIA
jgi:hypothetical protein